MHHFFVKPEQIGKQMIEITGGDVEHICNVLRMRVGEQLCIYDGAYREYVCHIASFGAGRVYAEIEQVCEQKSELSSRLILFQGLPKADKMDLIVQKAVELGAFEIVPVRMKRCVVKWNGQKEAAKVSRWNAIAESAAKQSGRAVIPEVRNIIDFSDALSLAQSLDAAFLPYERYGDVRQSKEQIQRLRPGQSIGVFIGPEGGMDEPEVELAGQYGVCPISLGRRILRTETAGLCALSILMFHLEQ